MIRWAVAVALCLGLWLVPAAIASADRTGGSIGGGDWSAPPAPSSSSSSTSSTSTPTLSHCWSCDNSPGTSTTAGAGGGVIVIAVAIGLVVFILVAIGRWARSLFGNRDSARGINAWTPPPDAPVEPGGYFDDQPLSATGTVDVTVLRFALDGRARAFVATELARALAAGDPSTADGRSTRLREIALMLRRLKDTWIYGGAVNEPMRREADAIAVYRRHVDDARARLAGAAEADASGAIVLTLVIAARGELVTVRDIGDGSELRLALESASHRTADDLLAIELIVQPADGRTIPLEAVDAAYPRPQMVGIRGSLVGKVFCASCGGPFPAELVSCPHCGAPATGAAAAT